MRSSEVCHPVRAAAELPVRIPKLRVAGSNPVPAPFHVLESLGRFGPALRSSFAFASSWSLLWLRRSSQRGLSYAELDDTTFEGNGALGAQVSQWV